MHIFFGPPPLGGGGGGGDGACEMNARLVNIYLGERTDCWWVGTYIYIYVYVYVFVYVYVYVYIYSICINVYVCVCVRFPCINHIHIACFAALARIPRASHGHRGKAGRSHGGAAEGGATLPSQGPWDGALRW